MAERETQISGVLQQWRGVDQRTQPTLVQDGFFVMTRGVFFGLGDNAQRVPGKRLAGLLPAAIFQIVQFGEIAIVQSMNTVNIVPIAELAAFAVVATEYVTDLGATVADLGVGITNN